MIKICSVYQIKYLDRIFLHFFDKNQEGFNFILLGLFTLPSNFIFAQIAIFFQLRNIILYVFVCLHKII